MLARAVVSAMITGKSLFLRNISDPRSLGRRKTVSTTSTSMPISMVVVGRIEPPLSSIVVSREDSPSMLTISSIGTTAKS